MRNRGNDYKLMNDKISYPIYDRMKRGTTNNLEDYKKRYRNRYKKKNGLAKLDCYCEKKIFDIFGKVETLAENMHNNRKFLKRIIYKRLGLPLFLLVLLPFNVIFLRIILYAIYNSDKYCFSECDQHEESKAHKNGSGYTKISLSENQMHAIKIFNNFMLYTLFIIVIVVLIYILIKVIKYEKLKSGKSKMNIKEYCHFCKDIFV
ncbi:hypothetical protein PVNG_06627 [Plasmodium vivax North Korean]|uniref:Variable surface protein n=1 Tax=Plasmodium vivax North Korean TaxID=1035514 RepID=A0A0J9TMQ0_PLAVI|nr:hypothetical protein PVNG_06627 [Plasmodium vivax North Korean]